MSRPKLAIVSSASDRCGIAIYADAIAHQLGGHADVEIVALDQFCLRNDNTSLGDRHIAELTERLGDFDAVNIHFEFGIIASNPRLVFGRMRRLIESCRKVAVTFHTLDIPRRVFTRSNLRALVTGKISTIQRAVETRTRGRSCWQLAQLLQQRGGSAIVHTLRDRKALTTHFPGLKTVAHPLAYGYVEDAPREQLKRDFHRRYQLAESSKVIGVFGFLSRYKGHMTAIQAIEELPPDYHLFLFGSQHPASIVPFAPIDPYIKALVRTVKKRGLDHRITFVDGGSDRDFFRAMQCCDAIVLPYLEVGQSASGIAALALESGSYCVMSGCHPFIELTRFNRSCYSTFSIGNYLELAQIIRRGKPDDYDRMNSQFLERFNARSNAQAYFDALGLPWIESGRFETNSRISSFAA